MTHILKDATIYLVIKHWADGDVLTQEENIITTEQGAIDSILQGGAGDKFEVAAFNPVEGWSRDVTEDIASASDELTYDGSFTHYQEDLDNEFHVDDSAYENQVANQLMEAAE